MTLSHVWGDERRAHALTPAPYGQLVASALCPLHRWARNVDQPRGRVPPPTPFLPVFRGRDLEEQCELERALAARSRHGELVFTIATEQASSYALNLISGLKRAKIDFSLIIVLDPGHCELLSSPPWSASCAHTSFRTVGLIGAVTHSYRLEWSKLHYLRRMIALGISPMFLDADVAVIASPFPLLREPALADKHAIFAARIAVSDCGRVLLGFIYCNRCAPGGPAERMFARAFARHEAYALADNATVQSWWEEADRRGVCTGPHKHVPIHRSNELMGDIALSACCGRAVSYAVAPASKVIVQPSHRFFSFHALPACGLMAGHGRQLAPGVHSHPISHWHEPTLGEEERRRRLQPLASGLRTADGPRFKAVPDMDRFIGQMSDLAHGRFAGEPAGISDESADRRSAELPAGRGSGNETLVLAQAPLLGNFFDASGGGREGGFQGANRPALAHFVSAHPKERYMQAQGLFDFRVAPASWLAARQRAERDSREAAQAVGAAGGSAAVVNVTGDGGAQLRASASGGGGGGGGSGGMIAAALKAISHSSFNAMATDLLAAAAAADELFPDAPQDGYGNATRAGDGTAVLTRGTSLADSGGESPFDRRCVVGRALLSLNGAGLHEQLRGDEVHTFARRFNAARAWLALAAGLTRTRAVDLSVPCAQPWVPSLPHAYHGVDQGLQPEMLALSKERLAADGMRRFTHLHVAAVPYADACEGGPGAGDGRSSGGAARSAAPSGCCSFVWEFSTLKDSNVCRPTSHAFYHCTSPLSPVRLRNECADATRATIVLAGEQAAATLGWRPTAAEPPAPAANEEGGARSGSIDAALLVRAVLSNGVQLTALELPAGYALPTLRGVSADLLSAAIARTLGIAGSIDSCGDYCRKGISRKGTCAPFGPSLNCSAALDALAREVPLLLADSSGQITRV